MNSGWKSSPSGRAGTPVNFGYVLARHSVQGQSLALTSVVVR